MFCNATCADASNAHDLADAMCSCGDGACALPEKSAAKSPAWPT
jgi:hypothetical protein